MSPNLQSPIFLAVLSAGSLDEFRMDIDLKHLTYCVQKGNNIPCKYTARKVHPAQGAGDLTFSAGTGKTMPFNGNQSKSGTRDFFAGHPVFSLDEARAALSPPGGRRGTVERLKHHLEKGRLKLLAREIYAVVPPDVEPARFLPDPFLTAVAVRADALFSHHSALELLGAAHSVWNQVTLYTGKRRR
ncbi:MAG: hypothetical protein WAU81_01365, partial [Candidatus Aminicenantales bacterium]